MLNSLSGSNLAPTKGLQVLISDVDRHAIVLGADPIVAGIRSGDIDPLLVAFSDQENINDYTPTAGCIALKRKDFEIFLKLINEKTKIKIG